MAEPSHAARIVRNTLANGVGTFAGIAIGLVVTPLIINDLGLAAYGVWTLGLTLTFSGGYAALADLGIEAATIRYVAEARADGDIARLDGIAATTLAAFTVLGVVLAGLMVALAGPLASLFGVEGDLRDAAVAVFAIIGLQLVVEFPSRAFLAVLRGAERFVAYQAIELLRALVQAGLWIGALALGLGLEGLGAGLAASTLVVLAVSWRAAHRAVPGLRMTPRHATRAELRRLVGYGSQVSVLRLLGTIYRQMDKLILGVALGPSAVALYDIASKIVLFAQTVLSLSVSALTPAAAGLRRAPAVLRELFLRGTTYSLAVTLAVVIGCFALAEPLIVGWIGEEAREAAPLAQLFIVYLLLTAHHSVGYSMLVSLGHMRAAVGSTVANVLVNLAVSIALVGPLGIDGVIIGTIAGSLVQWPVLLLATLRTFDVGAGEWLRRTQLPQLPGALVQGALLALLASRVEEHLLVAGAALLLSTAVFLAMFAAAGVRGTDREALRRTVRQVLPG